MFQHQEDRDMFDNGRITVGVFINKPYLEPQNTLCTSLRKYADEMNFNIIFLSTYELKEMSVSCKVTDVILTSLFPVDEFDAIIIVSDSFAGTDMYKGIIENIKKKAKGPVVSINGKNDYFYNVECNESVSFSSLFDFLYSYLGLKDIRLMLGNGIKEKNNRILDCYLTEMNARGLSVMKDSVLTKKEKETLFHSFLKNNKRKKEAVICSSISDAMMLYNDAFSHHLRVPDDFKVAILTDGDDGCFSFPFFITCMPDYESMAREALSLIKDLIRGGERGKKINVFPKLLYDEGACIDNPCCRTEFDINTFEERHVLHNSFMASMCVCRDFEKMKELIRINLYLIGNVREFYLCMTCIRDRYGVPVFSEKPNPEAEAVLAIRDGIDIPMPDVFLCSEILPSATVSDEPICYFITALHNGTNIVGYTAISFDNIEYNGNYFFNDWHLTVALSITEYSSYHELRFLMDEKERISQTDFMTGLLNRRGLNDYVDKHWDNWIHDSTDALVLSIDMDELKQINDCYGHDEGDKAICAMAETLKKVIPEDAAIARTGGDEFAVLMKADCSSVDKLINFMRTTALEIKEKKGLPIPLEFSIGSFLHPFSLWLSYENCLRKSDARMYKDKINRQKQRKSGSS